MSKVVSINSKKFLGEYLQNQDSPRNFEENFLSAGTILSVAIPPMIALAYAGIMLSALFAGAEILGVVLGAAAYKNRRLDDILQINFEVMPKSSPGGNIKLKKVA